MTKSIVVMVLTAVFASAGAAPVFAQAGGGPQSVDRPLFLDINAGIAGRPDGLTTGTTFALFGENGSAVTRIEPDTSALLDARLGYRIRPHVGVAVGVSGGQSDVAATTTASVPSPIRFASPTIVSLDGGSAKRREIGFHLQAVYAQQLTDTLLLSIAGGPSIVHLQQGVPSVTVSASTPAVASANETGNGFGGNIGADLSSLFSTHYGVGVFVRYVRANIDLPSASGVKAGGVQAGAGLRVRF